MKHLKLFEEKEETYNKFIISQIDNEDFFIWELLNYHKDKDSFTIIKRYQYTNLLDVIEYDNTASEFDYPKETIYDDVVFQTNDINEAIEYINMRLESKKYNL